MYSDAFSSDGVTIQQITEWNMFVKLVFDFFLIAYSPRFQVRRQ